VGEMRMVGHMWVGSVQRFVQSITQKEIVANRLPH
jgi:hypothetical protein